MNSFKRWFLQFGSRVDTLASRVENHDALMVRTISDMQRSAAKACVHLERVKRDGARLNQERQKARQAAAQWKEQALKFRDQDENKAIECLRRHKAAQTRAEELDLRFAEHSDKQKQLQQDVGKLNERLAELKEKRNLMRTREARAEATAAVVACDSGYGRDFDDLLERWEITVTEKECRAGFCDPVDEFERTILEGVELDDLKSELALLRQTDGEV